MTHPLFAPNRKLEPLWLDDTPHSALATPDLPGAADVAVVGSGYTGLVAALTLTREGRSVVVFDAEDAGHGCSSRNGGQCGAGLKPSFDGLTAWPPPEPPGTPSTAGQGPRWRGTRAP